MDIDDDMEFDRDAVLYSGGGPLDGEPPLPPGGGPPGGPPGGGPPSGPPHRGPADRGPLWGPPGGEPPEEPPGAGIPEDIWRWIMYLKRSILELEREATINKMEIGKSAAVAAKAQKELDIAKFAAWKLSGVVTKLQRRLDRLGDLRRYSSDRAPALESGSADSWGPGPDPGRSHCRTNAPPSDYAPSTRGSARRSNPLSPRHSGQEERDKWLSAEYRRRRDPPPNPCSAHAAEARPRATPTRAWPIWTAWG